MSPGHELRGTTLDLTSDFATCFNGAIRAKSAAGDDALVDSDPGGVGLPPGDFRLVMSEARA